MVNPVIMNLSTLEKKSDLGSQPISPIRQQSSAMALSMRCLIASWALIPATLAAPLLNLTTNVSWSSPGSGAPSSFLQVSGHSAGKWQKDEHSLTPSSPLILALEQLERIPLSAAEMERETPFMENVNQCIRKPVLDATCVAAKQKEFDAAEKFEAKLTKRQPNRIKRGLSAAEKQELITLDCLKDVHSGQNMRSNYEVEADGLESIEDIEVTNYRILVKHGGRNSKGRGCKSCAGKWYMAYFGGGGGVDTFKSTISMTEGCERTAFQSVANGANQVLGGRLINVQHKPCEVMLSAGSDFALLADTDDGNPRSKYYTRPEGFWSFRTGKLDVSERVSTIPLKLCDHFTQAVLREVPG